MSVELPPVRQFLRAIARGERRNEDALRVLLEHDDWRVPLEHHPGGGGEHLVVPRLVMYGGAGRVPADRLWLFTDDEAATRAAGHLSRVAAGIRGVEAFAAIRATTVRIEINPASDPEDVYIFDLDERSRPGIALWRDAIALEKALAESPPFDDPTLQRALRGFEAYLTFLRAGDGAFVTIPGHHGLANPALVFTAPDNLERFVARVAEADRAALQRVGVPGDRLFDALARAGVDGAVLNPFGPGPTRALPLDVCRTIASAGTAAAT